MAIALHDPEKLHARNKGALRMARGQMHKFAETSEKGLPRRKGRRKKS